MRVLVNTTLAGDVNTFDLDDVTVTIEGGRVSWDGDIEAEVDRTVSVDTQDIEDIGVDEICDIISSHIYRSDFDSIREAMDAEDGGPEPEEVTADTLVATLRESNITLESFLKSFFKSL